MILNQDKISNGVFCIKSGTVQETSTKNKDLNNIYGMGSILFLGNMINPSGHAISTITALNKVELIFIPYQSII